MGRQRAVSAGRSWQADSAKAQVDGTFRYEPEPADTTSEQLITRRSRVFASRGQPPQQGHQGPDRPKAFWLRWPTVNFGRLMGRNFKISLGLIAAAVLILVVVARVGGGGETSEPSGSDLRIRPDSQRLSEADDGKATLVEFLDFECEYCGAAYPAIEQLLTQYDGRLTFVVRYFPLHFNSEAAAQAAEAAAAQGKFEEMYDLLFQTQPQWAEQSYSQEELFFSYAEQLGLDMTQFGDVYRDPATIERIRRDKQDGVAVGVEGTPTFFFNGEKVEVSTLAELVDMIGAALAA